ncbi:putative phosphatidylinositol transfer protein alpha isoform isoform X3 [Penaeus vannamei]|uniref:Putative phosphatidylinositol transfer protein alpha isoform isoform X3 n=1 Tax=Penaeus vannamei TaxID=6689 RepID=A0A3R7M9Y8_PENVA|nr:putative phosphatidylinositol transfer protein alpha isoform isoform X3 [Penaeus vannamei]
MLVKEFRVMLPLTVEEYHLAQLYGVAEVSKRETGGGEGVEVVKNEPFRGHALLGGKFTEGQYTYKIYHLKKKVPAFVRLLAPEGALEVHEESWNAYPYSKTVYSVHQLSPAKWQAVEVVKVDIVNDPIRPEDYKEEEDPTLFKSTKTGRGPLRGTAWWAAVSLGEDLGAF